MKKKLILKIVLVVAGFGLILAGVGGYFGYMQFIKPTMAFQKATEAMENFETAKFDIVAEYTASFPSLGMNMDVAMDGSGKVDVQEEAIEMDMVMSMMGEEMNLSEVIIGDEVYIKMNDGEYQKGSIADVEEQSGMTVEGFQDNQNWTQYADTAAMEYLGKEEIDGKDYYAYKINITDEDFNELVDNLLESLGEDESSFAADDVEIEGVKYKVWTDPKTSMPYRERLIIEKAVFKGDPTVGDMEMDMEMEMTYREINEPVEIEAPEL
jgi:hypothetical protein